MTRRYPTDAERRALTHPCRLCGAHASTWCRTVYTTRPGKPAGGLHGVRVEDGAADGKLPLGVSA